MTNDPQLQERTAQRNFNGDACALASRIYSKLGAQDQAEFWRLVRLAQAQQADAA